MPLRYSGNVIVRIEYIDPKAGDYRQHGHYKCWLSWPGGRNIVFVEPPKHLTMAVDSPKAFDASAHAALSFTDNESSRNDGFEPDYSDNGFQILRKKKG